MIPIKTNGFKFPNFRSCLDGII